MLASDILNKLEIGGIIYSWRLTQFPPPPQQTNITFVLTVNIGSNPGLAAIWEDEQQRRREANESSHITAPPSDGENV